MMRFLVLAVLIASFLDQAAGLPLDDKSLTTGSELLQERALQKPDNYVRHEWHEAHHGQGWRRKERVDPKGVLSLRIGLKQRNIEEGERLLLDISDPKSSNYGKHLTSGQVVEMFGPSINSVTTVKRWLIGAGFDSDRIAQSGDQQWMHIETTVDEVEKLLFSQYYIWEHKETGVKNLACTEYHVPENTSSHIDYITPGVRLMSIGNNDRTMSLAKRLGNREHGRRTEFDIAGVQPEVYKVSGGCEREITPECVRNQYHIPTGTRSAKGNELGIFESLVQHYHQDDLDQYYQSLAPEVPLGTHPELRSINGATGPTNDLEDAGLEADLDFQVAIPLIWPQKTVLWQTDDEWYQNDMTRSTTNFTGFFNTFFDAIDGSYCTMSAFGETGNCARRECADPIYPNPQPGGYKGRLMCGVYKPTKVIAISYSGVEHDLPHNYMQRQCLEALKLGLQGVTVVESSGDHGVGGTSVNPKSGCLGPNQTAFSPRTMSNCPYVLSVGATVLVNDTQSSGKLVERATNKFPSGGGFSNVFATPPWQVSHVSNYLKAANVPFDGYIGGGRNYSNVGQTPGRLFNMAGRGYPDVSAIGDNYRVFLSGAPNRVSGTSVAVPIWASVLTLINEERLARGKSTVGFIHPVIYQHPEVFNDIKNGSNPGCGTDGFPVSTGWDPVTGLGSPIYPRLLDLFLRLP